MEGFLTGHEKKNNVCFRKMLREAINIKTAGEVSVSVDINPETVI